MTYSPLYFAQQGAGSSRQLLTGYTNASATTAIPQGMACSVNSSGLLTPLDVSSDASWKAFVGYANARIPASGSGAVIPNGRLENYTTSFPPGTALYIGIDGNPTNAIPSVGTNGFVSGDMILFMGVIVTNEDNPSASDIALLTQLIGTL